MKNEDMFKLIANELREYYKDRNVMRIQKMALCFDKLSEMNKKEEK